MTLVVLPADLGVYLGDSAIDTDRATLILQLATDLCSSVVDPLPDTAKAVVLGVAARAYSNVSSAHSMGIGTANVAFGNVGTSQGVGGLYLSKSDIATLRRLAGRGGAFSIDPTPEDAGQGLPPWGTNVQWLGPVPLAEGPL